MSDGQPAEGPGAPEEPRGSGRRPLRQILTSAMSEAFGRSDGETELIEAPGDTPQEAEALLQDARRERASDIHLDPLAGGMMVRLRIDGAVLDASFLRRSEARRLVNQFKAMARINPGTSFMPQQGRVSYMLDDREVDLRIAVAPSLAGDKMTIRILEPSRVRQQVDELGLRHHDIQELQQWLGNVYGMLLVAGPTGAGKTTTLYALLQQLQAFERTIVTIEDPVEYQVDGITQMQVDRVHGFTFAEGTRAMLRMDPDFLLLGEIRDELSARAATDAASSGHPLMSTLHSRDAVGVVDVLRNFGLNDYEISSNLEMVISQRLVRKLCPHCRKEAPPTVRDERWLKAAGLPVPATTWHPQGCEACSMVGFRGRTGVFEIWRVQSEEYFLILHHADQRTLREHLANRGHRFLIDDALGKAAEGVTSLGELRNMGAFGPTGPMPGPRPLRH